MFVKSKLDEYLTMQGLTPRQIDVARLMLTNMSIREISAALFVAQKTVKFHITYVYKKLKTKNRVAMLLLLLDYVVSEYLEVEVHQVPKLLPIIAIKPEITEMLPLGVLIGKEFKTEFGNVQNRN